MNWKDYPHLFANGKFEINVNRNNRISDSNPHKFRFLDDRAVIWWTAICDNVTEKIDDCTLIARPISDITDEEIEGYFNAYKKDYWKEMESFGWRHDSVREGLSINGMSSNQLVYLLSIGVYPFDDDTDVIYK